MSRPLYVLFTFSVLMISMLGCKSEPATQEEDLTGQWEVIAAERNGRSTETLNGAIFSFGEDGTMATNVTGFEDSGAFTLDESKISFMGTEHAVYEISKMEGTQMELNVELRGYRFHLVLQHNIRE